MAKKFPPGPCVHCLKTFEVLTSDHVFPKAWFPDSTPANLERWQVPACRLCNESHGRSEDDLLQRLSLCLDDRAMASLGLGRRLAKALDPARGRDARDTSIREKRGAKLFADIKFPDGSKPVITLSGNTTGLSIGLPRPSLERLGVKIIRGLTYLHEGRLISEDYDVFCEALDTDPGLGALLSKHGAVSDCGPGIQVTTVRDPADPIKAGFAIRLFGQYSMQGGVLPRNYQPVRAGPAT